MDSKQYLYKGAVLVFVFFSLLIVPHYVYAQAGYSTNLYFSGYIQDQAVAGDLTAGVWSVPIVYDWDSDGAKDLLVGMKGAGSIGYVSFYRNIGTDSSPSFSGYTNIQACSNTCSLQVPGDG